MVRKTTKKTTKKTSRPTRKVSKKTTPKKSGRSPRISGNQAKGFGRFLQERYSDE